MSIAHFDKLPPELRERRQWVVYQLEDRGDSQAKVPYTPCTGQRASATDQNTWASFSEAVAAIERGGFAGIGFVFSKHDPFTGIDLDNVRDPETGAVEPWASDLVKELNSYSELSLSGKGAHVIVRGKVPGTRRRQGQVEMYDKGRFFVMTGVHLSGKPMTVENRQEVLNTLHARFFGTDGRADVEGAKPPTGPISHTDDELIKRAREAKNGAVFATLWAGSWKEAGYPSRSEADAALLGLIRFWTSGDKPRAFRLFEQSGLNRPKWEREDYRERTWARIADGERFEPKRDLSTAQTESQGTNVQSMAGHSGEVPVTPSLWFSKKFPNIGEEKYGYAVREGLNKSGELVARGIGEDFLAATLGSEGSPEAPTVFVPTEERFYTYAPAEGIFLHQREPSLIARLSRQLLDCSRACRSSCDTRTLEFRLRDAGRLSGVLRKGRGVLEVPHDFFATDLTKFLPSANGMLQLEDMKLLPFGPEYCRRNKLAVPFDPKAECPLFLDTLMRPALDPPELDLLQRWCGLALIGENIAQRILLLTGTAGGGKGTFIRVLIGIIGQINLAMLRPQLLSERFELGRFLGKTLLYGADVPDNFLCQRGASVLKSLTGYDPVTFEFKNSNESPGIICRFNVIATCNSRLIVRLEGDAPAWGRRLAIIEYRKPKPDQVIADLDRRILEQEGAGVLNWMLEGLEKIRADGWQLRLTDAQQATVDNLLLESESQVVFAREGLKSVPTHGLTVQDCHGAYVEFCNQRGWTALTRNRFTSAINDAVVREFGLTMRNDIPQDGKHQRGWKGLALVGTFPEAMRKELSEVSEATPPSSVTDDPDTVSQLLLEVNRAQEKKPILYV